MSESTSDTGHNLLADYLTEDQMAAELDVVVETLRRWRRRGEGPPITKFGTRVLYHAPSAREWLRSLQRHSDEGDYAA